jgi:putative oxidoreductase
MNLKTNPQMQAWGIALLRIMIGIPFLVHGLQKVFVMGIDNVGGFFGSVGIPLAATAAILVTAIEVVGGLALILGAFTRWAAIPLAITMLVAVVAVHWPNGYFFANNGYEYQLTLMAASVALFLTGSGAFAVDNVLARQRGGSERQRLSAAEQGA